MAGPSAANSRAMAWLYWKDYLGLDPADAAATAGWAIETLTRPQ
jgi:hypothetical protein